MYNPAKNAYNKKCITEEMESSLKFDIGRSFAHMMPEDLSEDLI